MRNLSNENIIHIKKNGIQYLQFRKLLEFKEIKHAYSLGTDWDFRTEKLNEKLPKEKVEKALNNYKKLANSIGVEDVKIAKNGQAHTDNVQIVKNIDSDFMRFEKTDGLITDKTNIFLATSNADCILFMFYDPKLKVIANVHSGWKGTLQRIGAKAINKMISEFNCDPKDIICCICPSIRKCHFEVDKDVKDMFEKEFQDLKISQNNDLMEKSRIKEKWSIDTVLINKILFKEIGLLDKNIIDSELCSVCNSDLIHSFRVEKENYGLESAIISRVY